LFFHSGIIPFYIPPSFPLLFHRLPFPFAFYHLLPFL